MKRYKKIPYCLLIIQLVLTVSQVCNAHNGNMVSLTKRENSLYYRICVLHSIPITYYIPLIFSSISVRLNNRYYTVNAIPMVQSALAQWRSATAAPGQPSTCSFNQVNQPEQAILLFELRHSRFPPEILRETDVDSFRWQSGENIISLIPSRLSAMLQANRARYPHTSDEAYINNYVASRMLHLTGHALGLDHPGLEAARDIVPTVRPRQDRMFFQAGNLTEMEWMRPHIMDSNTFGYLLELEQYLGRPVVLDDIRVTEAENQAIRYYLVHEWECMWPDLRSARAASLQGSSASRCFLHEPGLVLPEAFNLLLH